MDAVFGAWLSAAAGAGTGWAATRIRGGARAAVGKPSDPTAFPPLEPRSSAALPAILGALVGAIAYGAFLVMGMVVGLLTFNTKVDPVPAVVCVVAGCALFLALTWIQKELGPRFGLPPRTKPGPRRIEDLLDAKPTGGSVTRWLGGIGIPLLPVLYGLQCIVTQTGRIGYWIGPDKVHGGAAIALGIGWIGVGAFLHFHFFFGLHPSLGRHSRGGKTAALVATCLGFLVATMWSMAALAV